MRRAFTIAIALSVCLVVGLAAWLHVWDGALESRTLSSDDRVTVGDTVTFSVPEGWEGFYDRYANVPSWVPLGASARPSDPVRESLTIRKITSTDSPGDLLLAYTYHRKHEPEGLAGLPRVDGSMDVDLYSRGRVMIAVVSGGDSPVYLIGSAQQDAPTAFRRLWRMLDVRGAESP